MQKEDTQDSSIRNTLTTSIVAESEENMFERNLDEDSGEVGDTQNTQVTNDTQVKASIVPLSDLSPASNGVEATVDQRAYLTDALRVLVKQLSDDDINVVRATFKQMSDLDKQAEIENASDEDIRDGADFRISICTALLQSIDNPKTSVIVERTDSGDSVFVTDGEDPTLKERIFFESNQGVWKILKLVAIFS